MTRHSIDVFHVELERLLFRRRPSRIILRRTHRRAPRGETFVPVVPSRCVVVVFHRFTSPPPPPPPPPRPPPPPPPSPRIATVRHRRIVNGLIEFIHGDLIALVRVASVQSRRGAETRRRLKRVARRRRPVAFRRRARRRARVGDSTDAAFAFLSTRASVARTGEPRSVGVVVGASGVRSIAGGEAGGGDRSPAGRREGFRGPTQARRAPIGRLGAHSSAPSMTLRVPRPVARRPRATARRLRHGGRACAGFRRATGRHARPPPS